MFFPRGLRFQVGKEFWRGTPFGVFICEEENLEKGQAFSLRFFGVLPYSQSTGSLKVR